MLNEADAELRPRVAAALAGGLLDQLPDAWLAPGADAAAAAEVRGRYRDWFAARLQSTAAFLSEAADARNQLV